MILALVFSESCAIILPVNQHFYGALAIKPSTPQLTIDASISLHSSQVDILLHTILFRCYDRTLRIIIGMAWQ
jgi:hypothetical protein